MSHYILYQFDETFGNKEEENMATLGFESSNIKSEHESFFSRPQSVFFYYLASKTPLSTSLSSHQRICDVLQKQSKQSERKNKEKEDVEHPCPSAYPSG